MLEKRTRAHMLMMLCYSGVESWATIYLSYSDHEEHLGPTNIIYPGPCHLVKAIASMFIDDT